MYHEEKIIDGVLCWRGLPDGEWKQFTQKQLTDRMVTLREKYEIVCAEYNSTL